HAFEAGIDVMAVLVALDILGPGLDGRFHHLVFRTGAGGIGDLADAVEHEAHRAGLAQRAAILGEIGAHIGGGAVAVVGQRLNDDGDAARAIALIADLVVILAVGARCLLVGAVDIVLGHGLGAGIGHGQAQPGIEGGIGLAHLGGDGDFARPLGKDLGPDRIRPALAMHDVLGVGMASHVYLERNILKSARL